MIVKCQRALESNEPGGTSRVLFYNQARDFMWDGPMPPLWAEVFGTGRHQSPNRFFAEVDWPRETKPPTFIRFLGEQNW